MAWDLPRRFLFEQNTNKAGWVEGFAFSRRGHYLILVPVPRQPHAPAPGLLGLVVGAQVHVECVYEPPQEEYPEGFEVKEDPRADTVEKLAGLLGLKRVRAGELIKITFSC